MAAQEFGVERFTLWDSNSISMGGGWQAIVAARWLETGHRAGGIRGATG